MTAVPQYLTACPTVTRPAPRRGARAESTAQADLAAVHADVAEVHADSLDLPLGDETWTVLYTRSRREKQVGRACERLQVRYYLPLRDHRTGTLRRRVYRMPLFPSYVFACVTPEWQGALLETGAIARVIPVPRPERLLAELRQIRTALATGADLVPVPALDRGMWVRVTNGLFAGIEGLVAGRRFRRGRARLVLNVSFLGRGAAVEIDARDVEPVCDPGRAATIGIAAGLDADASAHRHGEAT